MIMNGGVNVKGFDKNKIKKQVVSGGIYIALAAAVVTVTINGVNSILGNGNDYDISEIKNELPEISDEVVFGKTEIFTKENIFDNSESNNENSSSDNGNFYASIDSHDKSEKDVEDLKQSGYLADGIKSEVITENIINDPDETYSKTSAEAPDVEYTTEPDPIYYEIYAKPAEGYIEKEYSDEHLLYSVTMRDYRTHNGIDITGDLGSPVKAINSGVIEDIYYDQFYGNTIKINHSNGIVAYYMNLSEDFPSEIEVGKKVSHGEIIGGIGNSAAVECAEVSHLHLSIAVNGIYIDPRTFLRTEY